MALSANYIWPATGATPPVAPLPSGCKMIVDITATADADATITIPHLMAAAPKEVVLTNLLQVGAGLSLWAATTINATNVILTKSTATGSGVAGAQVRCIIGLPNSLEL